MDYLVDGAAQYVNAAAVTAAGSWNDVIAVRINLTMTSAVQDQNATGGLERMQRQFVHVVTLRNRVS